MFGGYLHFRKKECKADDESNMLLKKRLLLTRISRVDTEIFFFLLLSILPRFCDGVVVSFFFLTRY